MPNGLLDLALVMLIAAGLSIVARMLRQPLVLAYLLTGGLIAYFNVFHIADREVFQVFADLGIMFLLFLVGLEINYTSLKAVGRVSLIVGAGQIVFTSLFGFLIARGFHFPLLSSLYIAVALTFSSTIIILKLLSEKRDLHSLYGKISIGFLLVQDFVAVLILLVLGSMQAEGEAGWLMVALTILKGAALFAAAIGLGRHALPHLFDRLARSQELLFLVALAWVFLVVAAVERLGFSIEIGGFLAGLALANSSEHFQIAARVKPLRDFFILIFFVILGSSAAFAQVGGLILPIIVFSFFVLIGNPLIVLVLMGLLGYRKRTSFLTGLTVAQISEFSLILVAMGLKLGHVSGGVVELVTAVGVITILGSTYLIMYGDRIFRFLRPALGIFERRRLSEEPDAARTMRPIILIGCHRTGESIAYALPREDVLVVDFDPAVVAELNRHGFEAVLGDVADPDLLERISFDEARLVISTSPDLDDNLALISYLDAFLDGRRPKIVVRAEDEENARTLYAAGADYALLPHFTAGQYLGRTIALDPEMTVLERLKEHDLKLMQRVAQRV